MSRIIYDKIEAFKRHKVNGCRFMCTDSFLEDSIRICRDDYVDDHMYKAAVGDNKIFYKDNEYLLLDEEFLFIKDVLNFKRVEDKKTINQIKTLIKLKNL